MNYIRFCFLMFLVLSYSCLAQDPHVIDSLQNELTQFDAHKVEMRGNNSDSGDTIKVNILNAFSKAYSDNDLTNSIEYAKQALTISIQIDFKKGMAQAYTNVGVINYFQGDYKNALDNCTKALAICNEINFESGIIDAFNYIGAIYEAIGNYPEGLKCYFGLLKKGKLYRGSQVFF